MEIALAILGSSAFTVILNRIFNFFDKKKDKQDQILHGITEVKTELQDHKKDDLKYRADQCRTRILCFSDEIRRDTKHSEESFNNILEDIDYYKAYCKANEDVYINSKADAAIRNIIATHDRCVHGELEFL